MTSEPSPARFGRYEILGPLEDPFGWTAHGALDPGAGRMLTLRWAPRASVSEDSLTAVLKDAQALGRVRHASVLNLFDAGLHDDRLFLAQESLIGIPLPTWLKSKRRGWREITGHFVALGNALGALHAAGVTCRDLSLDRVLINAERGAVLIDIGLARHIAASSPLATPTPEEAKGQPRDARSDQFALASMLHQALFGFAAYDAAWKRADVANARSIPPPLGTILDRALALDPAERFPTAVHFAGALHALVAHRPRAPRVVGAMLAASVLALSAGTAVGAWVRNGTPFISIARVLSNDCAALDRSFDGIWDATSQTDLSRALWRSASADAAGTWVSMRRAINDWVTRWSAAHDAVCSLAGARAGDALAADQRTLECLRQSRARLEALLDQTPELGGPLALVAVAQLGAPETCPATNATAWLAGVKRGATQTEQGAVHGAERAAFDWADGATDKAIETLQSAVAAYPDDAANEPLAIALANLGRLKAARGALDDAETVLTRALRMRERLSGPDDLNAAALSYDLGMIAVRKGKSSDAVLHHRRALGIRERAGSQLDVAASLGALAALERDAKRFTEAVESARRSLALTTELTGESSGEATLASLDLGWALLDAGKAAEAEERFAIAERSAQRLTGRASRLVARALEGRGLASLDLAASAKAVAALEEAVFILESAGGEPELLSRVKFHLALALEAAGGDRARALRLASAAREYLASSGDAARSTSIERWIAERGPKP